VTSWTCQGMMTCPIGKPFALVHALILIEKPPRERLSELRPTPPSAGCALVRPDNGRIDHLRCRIVAAAKAIGSSRQGLAARPGRAKL